jgi:hypothetical protein
MNANPYPTILTATDWNKKKGIVAKALAPTKLGDELRYCEDAYKLTPWAAVLSTPAPTAKLTDVDNQIFEAKGTFKVKIDHLKACLTEAKTHAGKVKTEWATNKIISKDLKTHLDNLIKAIDTLHTKIDADVQAGYKLLLAARTKIAADNPDQVKAQNDKMDGGPVVKAKTDPKNQADPKLKFKVPPTPPKKASSSKSESSESESEES